MNSRCPQQFVWCSAAKQSVAAAHDRSRARTAWQAEAPPAPPLPPPPSLGPGADPQPLAKLRASPIRTAARFSLVSTFTSDPRAGHVDDTSRVAAAAVIARVHATRQAADPRARRGRTNAGARRRRRRACGRDRLAGTARRPRGAGRVRVAERLPHCAGVRTAAEILSATGTAAPLSRAARSTTRGARRTAGCPTGAPSSSTARATARRTARRFPADAPGATGRAARGLPASTTGTTPRRAARPGVAGFARRATRAQATHTAATAFARSVAAGAGIRATGLDECERQADREQQRDQPAWSALEQRPPPHRHRFLPFS